MAIGGASAKPLSLHQSFLVRIFILVKKKVPFIEKLADRFALQINLLRSSHPEVFCKKVFLKILQNSQENTCTRVTFLIKLKALQKRLWHRCFHLNFAKVLRTPFLQNTSGRLLVFNRNIDLRLFHDGGPYDTETSPLISSANQWTGFGVNGLPLVNTIPSHLL